MFRLRHVVREAPLQPTPSQPTASLRRASCNPVRLAPANSWSSAGGCPLLARDASLTNGRKLKQGSASRLQLAFPACSRSRYQPPVAVLRRPDYDEPRTSGALELGV